MSQRHTREEHATDNNGVERSVWLADLAWPEVEVYLRRRRTIFVPLGSTEQHGPAGPLGVDTLVTMGLCEDAAGAVGALVAPPIWTGDSFHHLAFAGTISLRASTLMSLVTDVASSLATHGFVRQIWVNGHRGSNLPALTIALRELHEAHSSWLFAIVDPLHLGRDLGARLKRTPEHHAGALELSQVMHRFPGMVREEQLGGEPSDPDDLGGGYVSADLFGDGSLVDVPWNSREERAFAPTGAISSSAPASADVGREFHEGLVDRLADCARWFEEFERPGTSGSEAGT